MSKLKYDESFPERAGEYADDGMSNAEIAAKLDISEDTFYTYQRQFPEFAASGRDWVIFRFILLRGKPRAFKTGDECCLPERSGGFAPGPLSPNPNVTYFVIGLPLNIFQGKKIGL